MSKKFPKLRLILVYCVTLFFLSTAYLFLNTQKGLETAIELAQQWFFPGKLTIAALDGRLLGPIEIKNLHYKSSYVELSITSAQFDWHCSALLHGQFHLAPLSIDKLFLFIKEDPIPVNKKDTKPFSLYIFKHIQLNSINIKQALIQYGDNTLNLTGTLQKQWNFNWQLIIPQLKTFIPESKGQLDLKGKINGNKCTPEVYLSLQKANLSWKDWQLHQAQGKLHIDSLKTKKWALNLKVTRVNNPTFSLNPIRINLSGNLQPFSLQGNFSSFKLNRKLESNVIQSIKVPSIDVTAKLTTPGLETKINTNLNNTDHLNAYIQLPHFQFGTKINPKQEIKGSIQLTLKNLNYLSDFIPLLKNPKGLLVTNLNLAGSISSPKFVLTLNLQKGKVQIPSLGLLVNNINLAFHTDKNSLLGSGHLDSGKGSLTFQSKTQLNQPNFASIIELQGKNIDISNTEEYKITASPKLHIEADIHHIESTGFIIFPKANIKLNENNLNLVDLSNDVVFVNHKKKSISFPFTYKNKIKLQLGNDIRFNYQGLRTKITGALDIDQTSGHPTLATGELALTDGEYTYYGQSLQLQPHSSLNFVNSSIENPNLNVTANKQVWVLPDINDGAQNSKFG
ncbi:MAG: translocation/assembly module TamB domain-containing protein, partial [Rickettsiella sp.]|nr:translocation/assembly module TamB domain-containing protein [Rickettsiella sp.]